MCKSFSFKWILINTKANKTRRTLTHVIPLVMAVLYLANYLIPYNTYYKLLVEMNAVQNVLFQ